MVFTFKIRKRFLQALLIGFLIFGPAACSLEREPGSVTTTQSPASPAPASQSSPTPLPGTGKEEIPREGEPQAAGSSPVIRDIQTNARDYPGGQIPAYEKLEITFQVDTSAENLQLPYDADPPKGVNPGTGISVDAQFSPDGWRTIYTQPAFYYQEFQDEVRSGQEWFYPLDQFAWKVRFSPHQPGNWQFKLLAQDHSGSAETEPQSFQVVDSDKRGFIRVSKNDSRYFDYEDGTYFPGLGYNMNYDHVSWKNPILDNESNFRIMGENGIQLARIWLSQWGIYGPSWNPWNSINPEQHGRELPFTGLTFEEAFPGSEVSLKVDASQNPCMFIGEWKARPAVKQNTNYRVRVRYKASELQGAQDPSRPYGFVVKTGGWLWGEGKSCSEPGTGSAVTFYQNQNTADWEILEGRLNTGKNDFLPNFYLAVENMNQGKIYIDTVWIEEDLGNGAFGPNILPKPWMAHHLYMEQRNSYAFDKVLELAEENGVFFKIVIQEKNDWILNRIDEEGQPVTDDPGCRGVARISVPQKCPGTGWFYGMGRETTKVRWLQKAWWRYLQARWGYSTQIHSWELLNEGDPNSQEHYILADEFGKTMHQFSPNDHLVSTSFWHSFPRDAFWANPEYPNVDYVDLHEYIQESHAAVFADTALATYETSMRIGARQPSGAGKPVIRGETGFIASGNHPPAWLFAQDFEAVWLHNFIWGGINPGGLIESYWFENDHIYMRDRTGSLRFDHRDQFGAYYRFIKDIPLSNGNYRDAEAVASIPGLRAWGQKDLTKGRAHLWIQNIQHNWKTSQAVLPIRPLSGTVRIDGFQPGKSYTVQWWDPYPANEGEEILEIENILAETDGSILLSVENLSSDRAVKIGTP